MMKKLTYYIFSKIDLDRNKFSLKDSAPNFRTSKIKRNSESFLPCFSNDYNGHSMAPASINVDKTNEV